MRQSNYHGCKSKTITGFNIFRKKCSTSWCVFLRTTLTEVKTSVFEATVCNETDLSGSASPRSLSYAPRKEFTSTLGMSRALSASSSRTRLCKSSNSRRKWASWTTRRSQTSRWILICMSVVCEAMGWGGWGTCGAWYEHTHTLTLTHALTHIHTHVQTHARSGLAR